MASLSPTHPAACLRAAHVRIARPCSDLAAVERFYCEGLGFRRLGGFTDHAGFDGLMLGHEHLPYHLEFTRCHGAAPRSGDQQEDLLVFYIPDIAQWEALVAHLKSMEITPRPAFNPYWDRDGITFEDPSGQRIVLQNSAWQPTV